MSKKSGSTTKRLQKLMRIRVSNALFFSLLCSLVLMFFGFCYLNDSAYLGETNVFVLWNEVNRSFSFAETRGGLPALHYCISAFGKPTVVVDATAAFYTACLGIFLLCCCNFFIGMFSRIFARQKIRAQLAPLYKLTKSALEISDRENPNGGAHPKPESFDEDGRIHNLESAIDSLKPEAPNSRLQTGDKDLKGLETAINSLIERTRASYSQQIRFVSDASHELRTPIAVIKGYTDMLDRWGKEDEKILAESIAAIKSETDQMNQLVEQLLFLARGDSGRTKLKIQEFSLSDMLREIYDESIMIDKNHDWDIFAENEITAEGDLAMLKQACRILVDNAAKYTPLGETITLKTILDSKGAPTIVVQDNGIGIAGEDMSHIFDRFYRSDPARQQGGTGLGLAIAKWIVDRHEGYFEIISREQIGTRISIHLPKPGSLPREVKITPGE
ncbi:MAG: HAMP domain-containing sensor histidine kinase [Oscillospiraceae bacterium]